MVVAVVVVVVDDDDEGAKFNNGDGVHMVPRYGSKTESRSWVSWAVAGMVDQLSSVGWTVGNGKAWRLFCVGVGVINALRVGKGLVMVA